MHELARRAGTTATSVSRVLNETRGPGPEFCRQLARALKVPQVEVFQRAGLITDINESDDSISVAELWLALRRMTPAQRREVLAYARGEANAEVVSDSGDRPVSEPTAQTP